MHLLVSYDSWAYGYFLMSKAHVLLRHQRHYRSCDRLTDKYIHACVLDTHIQTFIYKDKYISASMYSHIRICIHNNICPNASVHYLRREIRSSIRTYIDTVGHVSECTGSIRTNGRLHK